MVPIGSLAATGNMYGKPYLGTTSGILEAIDGVPCKNTGVVTTQGTGGTTNVRNSGVD